MTYLVTHAMNDFYVVLTWLSVIQIMEGKMLSLSYKSA